MSPRGDYARYGVRSANYPGIIPAPGAYVEGQLYQDVDQAAVEHLDFFEGDLCQARFCIHRQRYRASPNLYYPPTKRTI